VFSLSFSTRLKSGGSFNGQTDSNTAQTRTRWSWSVLKVGTLVSWRGSVGLVMGPCKKRWAKPADVWVMWTDEREPKIESGLMLEVLNASR
jgi:hypothetical protein